MDYRFLKDEKDPIIDLLRTEAQDQYGELRGEALAKIAYDSGLAISTLRSWWAGDTKRPLNISVRLVLQALNCKVKIIRQDGTEVRGPRHATPSRSKSEKVPARAQATAH